MGNDETGNCTQLPTAFYRRHVSQKPIKLNVRFGQKRT
jgi:hypothetical protein